MSDTSKTTSTILVTGATGTIGKQVARLLVSEGVAIRVASRRPEALADLAALGPATAVRLDLEDASTYAAAFAGVDALFLVGPGGPGFGEHAAAAIDAARQAGVKHVVRYSALGASVDGAFPIAREHGIADEALERTEIGWTILQPTFYMDNFINFQGEAIRGQGAFYGASKGGKAAYVSSADIAAVAAAVLRDPTAHAGKRYVLTGPQAHADSDVADLIAEAVGKPVKYVDVGDEGIAASLRERGAPDFFVESMVGLERVKQQGWAEAVSTDVETVLGRPAQRFSEFLANRGAELR